MNTKNLKLCLCTRCVGAFYASNCYQIIRAEPLEVIKEPCDFCQVRMGYDFDIKPSRATSCTAQAPNTRVSRYKVNLSS